MGGRGGGIPGELTAEKASRAGSEVHMPMRKATKVVREVTVMEVPALARVRLMRCSAGAARS